MKLYNIITPELEKIENVIEKTLKFELKEVYGMLLPFIKRGGKRIRPALAVLSFRAVGGKGDMIITPAAFLEMFHNFTLIHDDIEDDSQFRRGKPTLHREHGIPIALNSGDALYTLIWKELAELDIECEIFRTLERMFSSTFKAVVEGQGVELEWERSNRFDLSEEDYFSMIEKKTATLLALSCKIGAFLGGGDRKVQDSFWNFGRHLGLAFQIQDDVLNVCGEFEKYRKEIGGDITEGKRTLMVIHSLGKATPSEREKLMKLLSSKTTKKEEIDYVISLFKKYGSIDYARDYALSEKEKAKNSLSEVPPSPYKSCLLSVADYVVKRTY